MNTKNSSKRKKLVEVTMFQLFFKKSLSVNCTNNKQKTDKYILTKILDV